MRPADRRRCSPVPPGYFEEGPLPYRCTPIRGRSGIFTRRKLGCPIASAVTSTSVAATLFARGGGAALSALTVMCGERRDCSSSAQMGQFGLKRNSDTLLFLRADCRPPASAGEEIRAALSRRNAVAGCFHVKFAQTRPRSLAWVSAGINMRSALRRSATGDQAIFVRKQIFDEIGGFPDWPLFEDVELVDRCRNRGKFVVIPTKATISARRYLTLGIWRTVFLIYALRLAFWWGASPLGLKRWFEDIRPHLAKDRRPEHAAEAVTANRCRPLLDHRSGSGVRRS